MPKSKKPDRILAGLRELCTEQAPGREFTTEQIAERCQCSRRNVQLMLDGALQRIARKMRRELLEHGIEPPAPKHAAP